MPIYEIECADCGFSGEVIASITQTSPLCPSCNGSNTHKRMAATSSLTGKAESGLPGPSDTGCCGSKPQHAGCAGPGSCCGKAGL